MGNTQVQPPEEAFCNLDTQDAVSVLQLYVMPSFFLLVMILGLPLNLISLWVFIHRLRRWTRGTVFLFNLTLADTSWLLALPFLINYHLDDLSWRVGMTLCRGVRMYYHNYFYLSVFFVTCVSLDRYLAIVHPLRSLVLMGRRLTCLLCVAVWVSALLLSVPVATMSVIQSCPGSNRTICAFYLLLNHTGESLPYSLLFTTIGFLLPLLSICYCGLRSVRELRHRARRPDPHHRQRRRLRRALSATLLLFALFYLPYHLSRNAAIAMRAIYPEEPAAWRGADAAFVLEMCLCSLITCVNPLFSCLIGGHFRREFHATFAAMLSHCSGARVVSVMSKRTRREVRARQRVPDCDACVCSVCTVDA